MDFFNRANVSRQRSLYHVRQERIKREGSPYYTWTVPATAAAATAVINVNDSYPASRKYAPLDWIEIVNNEPNNDLTLTVNGGETFPVPAKTIRTIDNLALHYLAITNDGAAITTLGKVVVTLQRQPLTIDKWARRQ